MEPASLEISVAAAPEPTISSLKWLKKTVSIKSFNILVTPPYHCDFLDRFSAPLLPNTQDRLLSAMQEH